MRQEQAARSPEAGYTLIEALISTILIALVIVLMLAMFDGHTKVARAQLHLSELQQSLRVAHSDISRLVRMAGRGPLPAHSIHMDPTSDPRVQYVRYDGSVYPGMLLPANGTSIAVRPNVADPANIAVGDPATARVLAGTDVLTVRGVITGSIFMINTLDPASTTMVPPAGNPTGGQIIVERSSGTVLSQDLQQLVDAFTDAGAGTPQALLLISSLDDAIYAVVELTGGATLAIDANGPVRVRLDFAVQGSPNAVPFVDFSPGARIDDFLRNSVGSVGILEEYRYFVRRRILPSGDEAHVLSVAQFVPNTETPYPGVTDIPIAENIFDLQVALGFDLNLDGVIAETPGPADEWLYNVVADVDTLDGLGNPWNVNDPGPPATPLTIPLVQVRITTLGRTARRDWRVTPKLITTGIEDHFYGETPGAPPAEYRRRTMQSIVELRDIL